jgi:hypothetical protein
VLGWHLNYLEAERRLAFQLLLLHRHYMRRCIFDVKLRLGSKFGFLCCGLALLLATSGDCWGAKLDSANWTITQRQAKRTLNGMFPPENAHIQGLISVAKSPINLVTNLTDNNLSTFVTLTNGDGLVIDLTTTNSVSRVFLTGTNHLISVTNGVSTKTIFVYAGNTTNQLTNQIASWQVPPDAGNPVDTEMDVRFSPVLTRYLKLELTNSWNIAEVEVYGSSASATQAVVLETNAPDALVLAASELSYYLGELSGAPVPVIAPTQTNLYTGTMFRIVDLASLAPDYPTMTNNIANGSLPNNVHVVKVGREVQFSAWPYRCVLWSVWEFLERQGVRWVYPEGKGDYVPPGAGINLSMLPLIYTPSATSIVPGFAPSHLGNAYFPQSPRQAFLYIFRNRWYSHEDWMFADREIPYMAASGITLSSNYAEGFLGHAGNFSVVVPMWKRNQNPTWFGQVGGVTNNPWSWPGPDMSIDDTNLIAWVAQKMTAWNASYPINSYGSISTPLELSYYNQYLLEPQDVVGFCECPQYCAPSNTLDRMNPNVVPWVKTLTNCYSGSYYSFVDAVARQVDPSIPVGALAYDSVLPPPAGITHLATNVHVEVVLYGNPGLPMHSPRNADFKQLLDGWTAKSSHLATWSYALLQEHDYPLPVPLVTATVDQAQYLAGMGALNGLVQADLAGLPYNPWNFYAWPRIRWNTNQTADTLLNEFFSGYFLEAATPMLAYYKTLENNLITNDISLHTGAHGLLGYYFAIGAFPMSVLYSMQTNLTTAEASATNWVVKERVAKIREGFDYVIANLTLAGTNLNDWSPYPVVPASGTYSVNLTNMVAPVVYSYPIGNFTFLQPNGHWQWINTGVAEIPLHFTQGGTYQVVVTAKGIPVKTTIPTLTVYLGPRRQMVTLSSTNFVDYTCSLAVPAAGVWNVSLFSDTADDDLGYTKVVDVSQVQIIPQ